MSGADFLALAITGSGMAQSGTLLFRRLAVGEAGGLPIRETAGCQSALRSVGGFLV